MINAFSNFVNPFDVRNIDILYCLSSGAFATKVIEQSLLSAVDVGENAFEAFKKRLVEDKDFYAPIKRMNIKIFASQTEAAKITGADKKVKAERQCVRTTGTSSN